MVATIAVTCYPSMTNWPFAMHETGPDLAGGSCQAVKISIWVWFLFLSPFLVCLMHTIDFSALLVALGCGLLIGIDRERHKGSGAGRKFAGVRSFALTALCGALAQSLQLAVVGGVLVLGLCLISHWRSSADDPGITTEVALFLCYLVGVAALSQREIAAGSAVVIAVLLHLRHDLHQFSRETLKEHEVRDGLMLAAAALVALPLLPNEPAKWLLGANPRRLWGLVVILMSLQAAGYIALRIKGPHLGLALSGFGSGFVSSTATVAAMGARYRSQPALLASCVAAALFSTVATFILLLVVGVTVAPTLLPELAPSMLAGLLSSALVAWWAMRGQTTASAAALPEGRAFSFKEALIFAIFLSVATALMTLANQHFGATALGISTTLAGFADVHAACASLLTLAVSGKLDAQQALLPLLLAVSSNTVSKIVAAWVAGGAAYGARVGAGLLLVLVCTWLPWLWSMLIQ